MNSNLLDTLVQERHDLLAASLRLGERLRLTQAAADAARAYFDTMRAGWDEMGADQRVLVRVDTPDDR